MIKLDELKKMTEKELNEEFDKATKDLFKIKFEVSTGASKANHEIGKLKKYRAQILTLKKQSSMEEAAKITKQKSVKSTEKK